MKREAQIVFSDEPPAILRLSGGYMPQGPYQDSISLLDDKGNTIFFRWSAIVSLHIVDKDELDESK